MPCFALCGTISMTPLGSSLGAVIELPPLRPQSSKAASPPTMRKRACVAVRSVFIFALVYQVRHGPSARQPGRAREKHTAKDRLLRAAQSIIAVPTVGVTVHPKVCIP